MTTLRGIFLKLAAVALFSVMAACVKAARDDAPAGETVFFRAAIALLPVFAYAWASGRLSEAVSHKNLRGHAWRGVIGTTAMGLSFAALGFLPLPEVVAITFAAPLIATILAILMLGETVRLYRWTAVCVGLIGVLVMIWPRLTFAGAEGMAGIGALLALVSAGLMALSAIHVRRLTRTEPVLAIVFWFHVTATVASLATLPFGWVWPDPELWLLLAGSGLFGGVAQILVTESSKRADASVLAPFEYTAMLYGLAIGWFVFDEAPSAWVLGGAVIVIIAGLLILWRERQLGLAAERSQPRPGVTPHG